MSIADNLDARAEALDALKALLNRPSRTIRTTTAHVFGRFVELRSYSPRELEEFRTDYAGVYAIVVEASPGTDIMILFKIVSRKPVVKLKLLDVVEVIGPSQRDAAQKDAQRYL